MKQYSKFVYINIFMLVTLPILHGYMWLQDTQYGDIDHFNANKDFTYDPVNFNGMPEYFQELRDKGMRTIIILVRFNGHIFQMVFFRIKINHDLYT